MVGMMLAGVAQAQQAVPPDAVEVEPAAPPVDATQAEATTPLQTTPPQGDVTTLGEVRAIKPEDEQPLDLYRFKSPVQPTPNRFSDSWSEPPTPEEVSKSGGYILLGISYGLLKAAQGLHKITGGRDQIQSAIARPPPELTPEQQQRAAAYCGQGDCVLGDGR